MWTVDETVLDLLAQHHAETILTIGNGTMATRGTLEEGWPGERRATFLHGIFAPAAVGVSELCPVPDWTAVEVLVDGHPFAADAAREHRRTLDLRTGMLRRTADWVAPSGAGVRLEFTRFISLAEEHLAALRVRVTPDADCRVEFRTPVRAGATPAGSEPPTEPVAVLCDGPDIHGLHVRTRGGAYEVALATRVTPSAPPAATSLRPAPGGSSRDVIFVARAGETVGIDKVAAYATSRDAGVSGAGVGAGGDGVGAPGVAEAAVTGARAAAAFPRLAAASAARWAEDWAACDVEIDGDPPAQLAVRFALFHLLIAGPRRERDASIGAKGLTGFGYRGHVFWDTETFMLPVFTHTLPHVARNLLDYRWRRLPQARAKAAAGGFAGAQFPWESADTGAEVTPTWLPGCDDPAHPVRIWTGDLEIHISADIAHAAVQYWRASGDDDWFAARGAELVLETARFYASRAERDADGSCHFRDVIGPDEYHEHVDDNAYTNALARWNLRAAGRAWAWLCAGRPQRAAELGEALGLTAEVLASWQATAEAIVVPVRPDGLIPQFAGYLDLLDVDLAGQEPRTRSLQQILGVAGANAWQAIKQPDVLMLLLLLEDELPAAQRRINYDYYTPRTDHSHGSSLGPAIQALAAVRAGRGEDALAHFTRGAFADLANLRGNADDGIHAASCGGVWQAVVFGFAGLRVADDGSWITRPALPAHWTRVAFTIGLRGVRHRIEVTAPAVVGTGDDGHAPDAGRLAADVAPALAPQASL